MASRNLDDCRGMAASTIVAIESVSFSYGKLRYIKDLPEAFIEVGENLPLAERLLNHLQKALASQPTLQGKDAELQILSGGLNESLELLLSVEAILREIRAAGILSLEDHSWSAISGSYHQMVVPLGKAYRIETQMLDLLLALRILFLCDSLQEDPDRELWRTEYQLSRAYESLSEALASLPASDSSELTPRSKEVVFESRIPQTSTEETIKSYHWTALSCAARKGKEDLFRVLLKTDNIDSDNKDKDGRTPLSWAAEGGNANIAQLLLEMNSDIKSRDNTGRTPLSWAAGGGSINIVHLLLKHGGDPESRDDFGRTPLSWAAGEGAEQVVESLLMKGCNVESRDSSGRTPLSWAVEKGPVSAISYMIHYKADLNSADDKGRTVLSWAAEFGRDLTVRKLLAAGVDKYSKDNNGRTPLTWAVEQGHEDIATELIEHGVYPNYEETSGWLPSYKNTNLVAANLQPPDGTLNVKLHQTPCAHELHQKAGDESITHQNPDPRTQHFCRIDMQNQLSLFCGLAGVPPPGITAASNEFSQASFASRSASISFIHGSGNSEPLDDHARGVLLQLNEVLTGLVSGATYLQQSGFCCNQFTVLTTNQHGSGQPVVRLNTILFDTLMELHRDIAVLKDGLKYSVLRQSVSKSLDIFESIFDIRLPMPSSVKLTLHYFSLVVQLFCLGLVLYSRAHVEGFHPIYLSEPLDKVILHGSSTEPDHVHIVVEHCELTCMGEMVGGKVFVFDFRTALRSIPVETKTLLSHLSATCEGIVDCWGPGSLLFADPAELSEEKIAGLVIRGGIISRLNNEDNLFHWGESIPSAELGLTGAFSYRERIVIGAGVDAGEGSTATITQSQATPTQTIAPQASRYQPGEPTQGLLMEDQPAAQRTSMAVTVKADCQRDYTATWKASQAELSELGTGPSAWKLIERNMLFQAGYQVIGQVGLAQIKQAGRPAKRAILDRWSNERKLSILEELHGIQVSLCTGVARRVPLRVLVRDDLMGFIRSLWINGWDDDLEKEVRDAMASKREFCKWISTLRQKPETKACLDEVVDKLLVRLKDTGFDKNEEFFAAMWPIGPEGRHCIKVLPKGYGAWCKMLKDTEWSATFAVATTTCLEVPAYWCTDYRRGRWAGLKAFSTFMFYSESGVSPLRCAETWQIRDGQKYWNGEKAGEVMFVARRSHQLHKVIQLVLWDKPQMLLKAVGSLWPSREVLVEITDMEQSGEEVLISCNII